MSYTMITEHHNCDNGYIALVNLRLPAMPDKVTLHDEVYTKKSEFHISLLCIKRILSLLPNGVKESDLIKDFIDFQHSHPLDTFESIHQIRIVEKDIRKALVLMVDVPALDVFFSELNKKYKVDLPLQPAHITLYTLQPEKGIGILSQGELETTSIPITIDELKNL